MVSANGVRITWSDLPAHLRHRIEGSIGSPVVGVESQMGGFSPGTADRVVTADGTRAFVKAVSPAQNETSAAMARRELHIAAALPADAPVPRLLHGLAHDDWVVAVFEDIDGRHPRTPWEKDELDAAVSALRDLAHSLTPSPVPDAPAAADTLRPGLQGWRNLAADPPADLDPWAKAHLGELVAAADRTLAALVGQTLQHCDIRADNMLVRPDGSIVFVDWPWASVGPAWMDRADLAINVLVHGGDAGEILAGLGDPHAVRDYIVAFTGFFLDQARMPPPPGLPTVRAFQRFQGDALLPWVRAKQGNSAD
jgi:aminoglycoside phosphotransferase (APT) family kinase protein